MHGQNHIKTGESLCTCCSLDLLTVARDRPLSVTRIAEH